MKTKTDVLIVGAGPTGLALATALQQAGIDHLLIDRLEAGSGRGSAACRCRSRRPAASRPAR